MGVALYAGGSVTNMTGGLIEGYGGVFDGVSARTHGVTHGVGVISNSGTILATSDSGSYAVGAYLGHSGSIVNATGSP